MYVMYISLNYHKLPVEIRERFIFEKDVLAQANQLLNEEKSILENVILSTCNRTEIYVVVDQIHTGQYYIKRFLANWFHVSIDQIGEYAEIEEREAAVRHLLSVTTGIDSKIQGEPQILGQVKNAFFTAQKVQATGAILNHLFQQAITFAKKMHTDYPVSEFAQSSGQAGLHQIKVKLADLKDKHLAVVGLGEMGQQIVRNASTMGFKHLTVVNRSEIKTKKLVKNYDKLVTGATWQRLPDVLAAADAIVLATAAREAVANMNMLAKTRPIVVIDLGVPRNMVMDEDHANVTYFDIDGLSAIVSSNEAQKQGMLAQMEGAVSAAVVDFFTWQKTLHIVPVIQALRDHALTVESEAYDSLLRKLPELDEHERKIVSKHMKSIINQMIKGPIKELKELSVEPGADVDIQFFCQIFGLENTIGGVSEDENRNNRWQSTEPTGALPNAVGH